MKYAKLINGVLTFPPRNKDNVINYFLNEELLKKDGYKPVIEAIKPEEGYYKAEYAEEENQITEVWIDITLETLQQFRTKKHLENTNKAKQAVENGYVIFKDAQFETNAQTVGDLTATMLMLQNERAEAESLAESKTDISYTWLSKDDKAVELTVEDFVTLGNLIAQYKNKVWNEKYLEYKTAIENAQTIEELNEIELDYGNFDI